MSSIFKKLISDELGEANYNKYFLVCQKSLNSKVFDSREIYFDIYEKLRVKDKIVLNTMQTRLNDSLSYAVRVTKTYYLSFVALVTAIVFLIVAKFHPVIIVLSIIVMVAGFLVKTYEYLINKYCFIDAQIVLVYKSVLDKTMLLKEIECDALNKIRNRKKEDSNENLKDTMDKHPLSDMTEKAKVDSYSGYIRSRLEEDEVYKKEVLNNEKLAETIAKVKLLREEILKEEKNQELVKDERIDLVVPSIDSIKKDEDEHHMS